MSDPESIFLVRPRRLRVIAIVATIALVGLTTFGWFALPVDIRMLFTLSQRLTLLGVEGVLLLVIISAASSYVRADATGVTVRNGLRKHQFPWSRVHKIILRPGDPWGLLLLTPADGRPFEADLDADKRMLMGIQAGDGEPAKAAVSELRQRQRRAIDLG